MAQGAVLWYCLYVKLRPVATLPVLSIAALVTAAAWFVVSPRTTGWLRERTGNFLQQELNSRLDWLGAALSYDSISPRFLGTVRIAGLGVMTDEGVALKADSAVLGYDVSELFHGRFVMKGLRLDGVTAGADADDAIGLVRRMVALLKDSGTSGASDGLSGTTERAANPAIEIRNLTVRLGLSGNAYAEARISAADLLFGTGAMSASMAGTIDYSDPEAKYLVGTASTRFSASGTASDGSVSFNSVLTARSDLASIARVQVLGTIDAEGVSMRLAPDAGLRAMEVRYSFPDRTIDASIRVGSWIPASFVKVAGKLLFLEPWLSSAYSGTVALTSDGSAAGTVLDVNLDGRLPAGLPIPGGIPGAGLRARGNMERVRVDRAWLHNDRFSATWRGEVRPLNLSADGVLAGSYALADNLRIAGELEVHGAGTSWFVYTPELDIGGAKLTDASLSVDLGDSIWLYADAGLPAVSSMPPDAGRQVAPEEDRVKAGDAAGQFREQGVALEPVAGGIERIVAEGLMSTGKEPYLEVSMTFGTVRLDSLYDLLSAVAGASVARAVQLVSVQGELSVFTDFKSISYNSSGLLVVHDGKPEGFGLMSLSGSDTGVDIRSVEGSIAGHTVAGTVSVDFGNASSVAFDTRLRIDDVPYAVNGSLLKDTLVLRGDYELDGALRVLDGTVHASVSFMDLPVPFNSSTVYASAGLNLEFVSPGQWRGVVADAELRGIVADSLGESIVGFAGSFDQDGGKLKTITYRDATSTVSGKAGVTWLLQDGFQVEASGQVSGTNGESYGVDGRLGSDGSIVARFVCTKAPLSRLGMPVLKGSVDLDASLSGTLDSPSAGFSFSLNSGSPAEGLPSAAGSGAYAGSVLSFTDTRLRYAGFRGEGLDVSIDLETYAIDLDGAVSYHLGPIVVSGVASASGKPTVPSAIGTATEAWRPFESYSVAGNLEDAAWTDTDLGTVPFSVIMAEASTTIVAGDSGQVRVNLGSEGSIGVNLARTLPLAGKASGRIADGNLSLDVSDAILDMVFLFDMLKLPVIEVPSGTAQGSLRIRGSIADPTVEGIVTLDNFFIRVPSFIDGSVGPLTEPVYFTGSTMESNQPAVRCGDATLLLSIEAALNRGIPDDIRVLVRTATKNTLPVSTSILGMDIDGSAEGSLAVEANRDRTRITGDLFMPAGDIVLTTGVIRRKPSAEAAYDLSGLLNLAFGKKVKVYFPTKRLPIVFGQADPSSTLAVSFDMLRGDYNIDGLTTLRGGSVIYIQRNFYLKNATISFDEDSDQFDPLINLEAETRSSNGAETVLVTVKARDRRLSDLSFVLESSPAMTETEIQQMLGQNLMGETGTGQLDLGRTLFENSDLIPQLNFMSIFERNLQELTGLDLFVLQSRVFQRWLYDLSGLSGAQTTASLADYLDDTAVVIGKYVGDKMFLQASLAIASDPLATGSGLSLDSEISMEWKAPHFTLNWRLNPQNFDSMFIEDQSISVSWRIPLK